jgi:arylsulfatase A-like enzyme
VVQIIRSMPDVAAAASFSQLEALPARRFDDPRDESMLYRLKYSAAPERAGEILFAFQPMIALGAPPDHDPAQHGTGWDYDRRVPMIFWGTWKAERRTEPVSTVDIAPTLAKELGIQPGEPLDGIPLRLVRRD